MWWAWWWSTRTTLHLTDVCHLLMVSSSCRLAVQQARSKQRVGFIWRTSSGKDASAVHARWAKRLTQLQGFAEWLPRHAGLITEVSIIGAADEVLLLQRHLALALRVCHLTAAAAAAPAPAPAPAAPAPSAAPAPDSRGAVGLAPAGEPARLCLKRCCVAGSWPEQQLLQELGAAGLQALVVGGASKMPDPIVPSCFASLSSSLQSLRLEIPKGYEEHSAGLSTALGPLTALTHLEVWGVSIGAGGHWPPMLQDLCITYDVPAAAAVAGGDGTVLPPTLDMSSLAELQCLDLKLWAAWDADLRTLVLETLVLPPNITSLGFRADCVSVSRVTGGDSVREVRVADLPDTSSALLAHLCRLPCVRSLRVDSCTFDTPEASAAVAAALGSAKGLTSLGLFSVEFAAGTGLCRQLASLPGLQSLGLRGVALPRAPHIELLCLTALASLTKLWLSSNSWADDVVVTALARHLTGLGDVEIHSDSLSSLGLLPVVGALTGLTRLELHGGTQFGVLGEDLMLLSGLTQLEDLRIYGVRYTIAHKQQFMACMPCLTDFW